MRVPTNKVHHKNYHKNYSGRGNGNLCYGDAKVTETEMPESRSTGLIKVSSSLFHITFLSFSKYTIKRFQHLFFLCLFSSIYYARHKTTYLFRRLNFHLSDHSSISAQLNENLLTSISCILIKNTNTPH